MHGDLTAFDARVAALNASVTFTAAIYSGLGRDLSEQEVDRAFHQTLHAGERFEEWLTRPEPRIELGPWPDDMPPLAAGRTDG